MKHDERSMSGLALRLKNAAPEIFDQFVNEFATYTSQVVLATTIAPVGEVLVAQGRAQQCRALLRMLSECHIPLKQPTPPQ